MNVSPNLLASKKPSSPPSAITGGRGNKLYLAATGQDGLAEERPNLATCCMCRSNCFLGSFSTVQILAPVNDTTTQGASQTKLVS